MKEARQIHGGNGYQWLLTLMVMCHIHCQRQDASEYQLLKGRVLLGSDPAFGLPTDIRLATVRTGWASCSYVCFYTHRHPHTNEQYNFTPDKVSSVLLKLTKSHSVLRCHKTIFANSKSTRATLPV